jgi:pteridine reductase
MGDPRLRGKKAAVTGGGRGLGRSLVMALAREGADVAFSYAESRSQAEQTAAGAEALDGLDLLVNNAGVFRKAPLEELTEELLDEAFDVNVKAAVMASRAAAVHMRKRGGGVIVNVASLGGLQAWRSYLPYCASKAALLMATRCLALALAPEVRVNAVAPGILDPPGAQETLQARIPLRRFGSHADVVESVVFLATSAAFTTGDVLRLDGGRGIA